MIIFRYLSREIFTTLFGVSLVLLLIIMSSRFVKYLAEASTGKISAEVLFTVIGLRLPGFLELILPLGLFLGVLLGYGRLYMESEMVVLSACGMSQRRLLSYTLFPGLIIALLVGVLSMYLGPMGMQRVETILQEQKQRSDWETLTPGRFERFGRGSVTYAESLSDDKRVIQEVFIAESRKKKSADVSDFNAVSIVVAEKAELRFDPVTARRYMVLSNGYRYEGVPGQADYTRVKFAEFGQLLPEAKPGGSVKRDAVPTQVLWRSNKPEERATLHWRLSLPLLVMVVTILAVPLSHTNPRNGRYAKMIPAIILYLVYLVALNGVRGAIEDQKAPVYALWSIHGGFLMVAASLFYWPSLRRSMKRRQAESLLLSKPKASKPKSSKQEGES